MQVIVSQSLKVKTPFMGLGKSIKMHFSQYSYCPYRYFKCSILKSIASILDFQVFHEIGSTHTSTPDFQDVPPFVSTSSSLRRYTDLVCTLDKGIVQCMYIYIN